MLKPITTVPNPILFKKTIPVGKVDKEIIDLIIDMVDTFRSQDNPKAVGLAANQVGRPEKIFLALVNKEIVPFINPEIKSLSKETLEIKSDKDKPLEGCLSIPGFYGEVKRSKTVHIKYTTLTPAFPLSSKAKPRKLKVIEKEEKISGFPATVIQHEMDHLEGHVFTEKVLSQSTSLYRVEKNEKGKEKLVEVNL